MCASTDCPVTDQPPAGETWCLYRLGLELARWVWGYDMRPGRAKQVTLT